MQDACALYVEEKETCINITTDKQIMLVKRNLHYRYLHNYVK